MKTRIELKPRKGTDRLSFGDTRASTRAVLGASYESFKRTPTAELPCDAYEEGSVFLYFRKPDILEAIEFASPARPTLNGRALLDMSYEELKNFIVRLDPKAEFEPDGLTSIELGLGVYAPEAGDDGAEVESIMVFQDGYYDS